MAEDTGYKIQDTRYRIQDTGYNSAKWGKDIKINNLKLHSRRSSNVRAQRAC
jgi:hypothetical protein